MIHIQGRHLASSVHVTAFSRGPQPVLLCVCSEQPQGGADKGDPPVLGHASTSAEGSDSEDEHEGPGYLPLTAETAGLVNAGPVLLLVVGADDDAAAAAEAARLLEPVAASSRLSLQEGKQGQDGGAKKGADDSSDDAEWAFLYASRGNPVAAALVAEVEVLQPGEDPPPCTFAVLIDVPQYDMAWNLSLLGFDPSSPRELAAAVEGHRADELPPGQLLGPRAAEAAEKPRRRPPMPEAWTRPR
jgi:hypothetical protein